MRAYPSRERLAHALVLLLLPATAAAQATEDSHGPTPSRAAVGNGDLVAGIGADGTLTTLRWPGADGPEHMEYETSDADAARFGAAEDAGLFSGLDVELDDGTVVRTWLRDADWDFRLQLGEDGALLLKGLRPDLGLVFEETLVADGDALHRRANVRREPGSTVTAVRYLLFSNLAPSTSTPSNLDGDRPTGTADADHDFGAAWLPADGALVHFTPAAADFAAVDDLVAIAPAEWATEGAGALTTLGNGPLAGTWLALQADEDPTRIAVGTRDDDCAGLTGTAAAPSAWADPDSDGRFAACRADAMLAWPLTFDGDAAQLDLVLAAGADLNAALTGAANAHARGFDAARADAVIDGESGAHALFGRSVRSLRAAYRRGAARPASLAEQPPRDRDAPGESFAVDLLDLLDGDRDAVGAHLAWYRELQERGSIDEPSLGALGLLPGSWAGGYRVDGRPWTDGADNGNLEAVALTAWTAIAHAASGSDAGGRDALGGHWPMLQRSARLMAACLTADYPGASADGTLTGGLTALSAGLPDSAARDAAMSAGDWAAFAPCTWTDDPLETALLLRLGLAAAADAADAMCQATDESAFWRARSDDLAAWALATRWSDTGWTGDAGWAGWPDAVSVPDAVAAHLSDAEDPVLDLAEQAHAAALAAAEAQATAALTALTALEPGTRIGLDVLRAAGSSALLAEPLTDLDAAIAALVDLSGDAVALGDATRALDEDADGTVDRLVTTDGTPHLPAMARVLLASIAAEQPELLAALSAELTPMCLDGDDPDLAEEPATCEGCESNVGGAALSPLALLLLGWRRRR